ncbi:MAG: hypothetical protein AAGL08_13855 [Cyanobacteria bacterium J06573_11]
MVADPFPSDPIGQKLCAIFSYRWMSLEGDTDNAIQPNWRTIKNYPLRPRSLWRKWRDAKVLAGVRFGRETEYALIDVDKLSKFLNLDGINAIRDALETIGIVRTIPIRSSWSGGLHLYCPLPHKVPTFDLACAIRYTLEAQEMHIEQGQLEVFPNTKAFSKGWLGEFSEYNGHRLPLQPGGGGALFDHNLNPSGAELKTFFAHWDFSASAQDMDALNEAMTIGRERHRKKPKMRSHPLDEWRNDWELEISTGWTAHGQTNSLLKVISGYGRVFLRLEGEELHEWVVITAMQCPGFDDYCGHHNDLGRKAYAWCQAAERYYWPLGEEPKREKAKFDLNAERAEDAQSRIKSAYEWLTTKGDWPKTVTAQLKALQQTARASFKTLYKYSHLWQDVKRCVTDHTASDHSDSPPQRTDQGNRLKPLPPGLLHTFTQITKGVCMKITSCNLFPRKKGGLQGGKKGFPQAEGAI